MQIHEIELLDFAPSDYPEVTFRVRCSTGTYVRSLADDMAAALGGRAHLVALRRTANGGLRVEAAHPVEGLEALAAEGRFGDAVVPPAAGLGDMEAVHLDEATSAAVRNGVSFPRSCFHDEVPGGGPFRMLDRNGRLLAVYRLEGGRARPEVVLS